MTRTRRQATCGSKEGFRIKSNAQKRADQFKGTVYECPICFLWHVTSKRDWKEDFVTEAEMRRMIVEIRTEYNAKLKKKNLRITDLEKKIKELMTSTTPPNTGE